MPLFIKLSWFYLGQVSITFIYRGVRERERERERERDQIVG